MMSQKILISGSCGFVFSNFVRYCSHTTDYKIVSLDRVDEPLGLHSIYHNKSHSFYLADVTDKKILKNIFEIERPDIVIHGAARTHVDESIFDSDDFYLSNVLGTKNIAECSSHFDVDKFILISTDEVYGHFSDNNGSWTEDHLLSPRNPYSASKAASELVVRSIANTYGLNFNITRCCNNLGPRQFPRNFVPKIIKSIIDNEKIPIYGDGSNIREWIYVNDHCSAILHVLKQGLSGEVYNVGTNYETSNLELVNYICNTMGKGHELISFIDDPRSGHDFRYSVNSEKLRNLGWTPKYSFSESVKMTVSWYMKNQWFIR